MEHVKVGASQPEVQNILSSYQHPPYILERELINAIKDADEQRSASILGRINRHERACLADSPIRSLKNSLIASCTLFTRAVIEKGVSSERAFSLSDECIRKIEECQTVSQTADFEYEMLRYFIGLLKRESLFRYSPTINSAIAFISKNIQHKMTVQDIAHKVNVHPNYLSSIFKKEVGISLSAYIEKQKSEAIRLFLVETTMSLTDIAYTFEFSSVSYFSSYFKKIYGVSPLSYRKKNSESL